MPSAPAMEVKTQEKSSLPLDNISLGEHLPAEPNPEQPSDTLDRSESEPMTAYHSSPLCSSLASPT